ncbi:MAG: putative lipid II flippase FtsW [Eubacteriales bacterium]|nr:putative lipid II flippase FtsW [Eubacteriales bacterium]
MEQAVTRTDKKEKRAREKQPQGRIDYSILLVVSALCAFGLVMVFSASYYYAQNTAKCNFDSFYYLKRQAIYLAIGYPIMLIISRINYRKIQKLNGIAILVSVVLLITVLIFGDELNGGKRWLNLFGVSIQPSEVAKFGMIIYMCSYMAKRRDQMKDLKRGMMPMLLVIGVIAGLIMLQPNMSMAVIVGLIGIIMLYLGGCDLRQLLVLGVVFVILFILFAVIAPYRLQRLTSFTKPFDDPQDTGYQLVQSFYAIGSGGLFGKGLNNSYQKLLYMTYGESDFIFAILCEEFGFVGGVVVLIAYGWIVYRGMVIALRCRNRFGGLLAAGISLVFGLQVCINVGVVTGLMPTTGQALPFISAGGTSLLIFLSAMGVLLNISRETHK